MFGCNWQQNAQHEDHHESLLLCTTKTLEWVENFPSMPPVIYTMWKFQPIFNVIDNKYTHIYIIFHKKYPNIEHMSNNNRLKKEIRDLHINGYYQSIEDYLNKKIL
jgi:hypothetical protein